jgi:hypothetical protein
MAEAPFGSKLGPVTGTNDLNQGEGRLKNPVIVEPVEECFPSDIAADVGILSCGVGKYCIESNFSSLGGICASPLNEVDGLGTSPGRRQRSLQVVRNQSIFDLAYQLCYTSNFTYYTCQCDLDLESSTGKFSCIGEERCSFLYSGCTEYERFQYCLSGSVEATLKGESDYYYTTW